VHPEGRCDPSELHLLLLSLHLGVAMQLAYPAAYLLQDPTGSNPNHLLEDPTGSNPNLLGVLAVSNPFDLGPGPGLHVM
jgi:hypothetical protein